MIPLKLRYELNDDEFYHKCCLTGKKNEKINWHHTYTYAGKQINEPWSILPIAEKKHNYFGDEDAVHVCKDTEDFVKYLSLLRTDVSKLCIKYPKKNWIQEFNYLHQKYAREFNSDKYSTLSKDLRRLWKISLSKK